MDPGVVGSTTISIHAPARGATGESRSTSAFARISIHAPARGATQRSHDVLSASVFISIHAPARGATLKLAYMIISFQIFQSTLPRGERRTGAAIMTVIESISIHAPARGATIARKGNHRVQHDFNPRSREGSDRLFLLLRCLLISFQSTLPRGERLRNSSVLLLPDDISIHAPARGATRAASSTPIRLSDFNPRSREGSDFNFI